MNAPRFYAALRAFISPLVLGLVLNAVCPQAQADFVIEAEDFNYESGQTQAAASNMPYTGGAYSGLRATENVDYSRLADGSSLEYRNDERIPMNWNPDFDRGGSWTMTVNYKLGWAGGGYWFNYTRNIPAGNYSVQAALSSGGTSPGECQGTLQRVTSSPALADQITVDLGVFNGNGTGNWGANALFPLLDTLGQETTVNLSGTTTLRFVMGAGDFDYLLLRVIAPPQISDQPDDVAVSEGGSATFSVAVSNPAGVSYQWQRGVLRTDVPGAITSTLYLPTVTQADSGSVFRCRLINGQGTVYTRDALLTVQGDGTAPTLTSLKWLGDMQLLTLTYSEGVEAASATNKNNYTLNNGASVASVSFGGDTRTVLLRTTTPLTLGLTYNLQVSNVRDRASVPNTIAANSPISTTLTFTPLDLATLRGSSETRGPSARTGGLVINEIMYNPTNRSDGRNLEFIEIYNADITPENLSGFRISGDVDYTFPTNTTLAAGAYLVVAPVPADIQAVYGIANVVGGFTNNLPNDSGTVRLRTKFGAVQVEVNYADDPPWPVAADNAGHSLFLARPSLGERNPAAWAASDVVGGTPGTGETAGANPLRSVFINEVLAHTDLPDVDAIELYNHSTAAVDISGCILTDDPATNRFVIPGGTSLDARGFKAYTATELGFNLSSGGETVYLFNPARTRVVDVLRFKAQANGVSSGRYPDGAPNFQPLVAKSFGAANARIAPGAVVINEIMYSPLSGDRDDEYIELYNRSGSPVNLGGWRLTGGADFIFPTNFTLSANGYVVVANNLSRMLTNYAGLTTNNTVGNYGGSLANSGERISLTQPDDVLGTNNGVLVTNRIHIVVDEVTYGDGGRWGQWSDGGGSSLELIDPGSDNRLPSNWADSDESAKGNWTTVQVTGTLDNGKNSPDEVQLLLQGVGECLIDNVRVLDNGGSDRLANSGFEGANGLNGWVPQGSHETSSIENAGYMSGQSLHIRARSRGDPGANRVRSTLTSALTPGTVATISANVRWIKGHPELLIRLYGSYLEAIAPMAIPRNLGTPGARNSRTPVSPNAGPAIHSVSHSPILPAAGQAITVSAQVHDADGVGALTLGYRVDPATNILEVPMSYNGAGQYSATVPGQSSGTLVAFHIRAADAAAVPATALFPNDAPVRECLVRFGEAQPTGRMGTYRLWITQATNNRWTTRLKLDNSPLDGTFVYGNQRVVYNIGTLYSGSPFLSPGYSGPMGGLCGYVFSFPSDDFFLGAGDFVMDWPIRDGTQQLEQIAFWMCRELGTPYLHRRYVHLYVNGNRRGTLYEDVQQPNADMTAQFFPDDPDGDLHKIEDWFEFPDNATGTDNTDATLQNFTTDGGAKKTARYRWNWRRRATDEANNYTNLFRLVDALNSPSNTRTEAVEAIVDVDNWARVFTVEHVAGNWDSYGYNRGKNMYVFKPSNDRFHMMPWDIDFVFSAGGDDPNTTSMFNSLGHDTGLQNFYSHPPFRRAYYRAWYDAVYGPMVSTTVGPLMDAKYNALNTELAQFGTTVQDPSSGKAYIESRRNYLLGQLATVNAAFSITSNSGNNYSSSSNSITLTGTAPVQVNAILVNGVAYPVTWTGVTSWSLRLALGPGANALSLSAQDSYGRTLGGLTDTITVTYSGTVENARDFVMINEIMYNPALPDASYVEIYNRSSVTAFDLSGWRLEGADFTFPGGSILPPGGFMVIAANQPGFAAAYGPIPVFGTFDGTLDNGGETLKLVDPGLTPDLDVIVDEVTYDDDAPWLVRADGFGPSLQLIDPAQDNNRVANWAVGGTNEVVAPPDWQLVQVTGTATSSILYLYLSGAGEVYVDDLKVVTGGVAGAGTNFVQNGDFESALTGPWTATANFAGSSISTAVKRSGAGSLRLVATAGGSGSGNSLYQTNYTLTTGSTYTLSFWYLPTTSANTLTVRFSGAGVGVGQLRVDQNIQYTPQTGSALYTPGAPNSVLTALPLIPRLWINEVQTQNLTGLRDNANDRDPWLELFHNGASAFDVTGCYLSDTPTNLAKWALPTFSMDPGAYRLLWMDAEPGETSGTNLHASFRLSATNGAVYLSRVNAGATSVLDYLRYPALNTDRAYGGYPDGTSPKRENLYFATPGTANRIDYPPTPVSVNEWMAGNTLTVVDPADGRFEDWFELFNAGPTTVNLAGFRLSDASTTYTIPDGVTVPGNGFLLVWADNDTDQNVPGSPDLHVPFALGISGDQIGLYAPNGTNIDLVSFVGQTNDISQGRWPDANTVTYFMTQPTPGEPNTIQVVSSNRAPVLGAIGTRNIAEGSLLSFVASATDPDAGQVLTYSLDLSAPAGAIINPTSGLFTWTPAEDQGPGSYVLTLRVTDNGSPAFGDFETFTVNVSEVNRAPTFTGLSNRTVNEGTPVAFTVVGSDPDIPSQTLTYTLDAGYPAGATIQSGTGAFNWTPTEAQGPGNYTLNIRVTDNGSPGLSFVEAFTVQVNEVNSAPTLAAVTSVTIDELAAWTTTLAGSDGDVPAQGLTYALVSGPTNLTVNGTSGLVSWTPSEAQGPSAPTIVVRVLDNGTPSLSATQTFTLTVREVNSAPTLAAVTSVTIDELAAWTTTLAGSDGDVPAQGLTYALVSGPTNLTVNGTSGLVSWTPSEAQGPSAPTIVVRVLDNGTPSLSATQTFTLTVREVNSAPVLNAVATQQATVGNPWTLTLTASDADQPTNSLTYSLEPGYPTGMTVNASSGLLSWTPSAGQVGTNPVGVRVTDNGSPVRSATRSFSVVVTADAAPVLTGYQLLPSGSMVLTWSSVPGKTYELQYKNLLLATNWVTATSVTASTASTSATNAITGTTERYYQVRKAN